MLSIYKKMGFDYIYIFVGYTLTDEQIKGLFKNIWKKGEKEAEKWLKTHPTNDNKNNSTKYLVEDQWEDLLDEYFMWEFSDEINKKLSGTTQIKNGNLVVYKYPCCMFNNCEGKARWILGLKVKHFDITTVGSISIESLITKSDLEKKLKEFDLEVKSDIGVHMVINDCYSCG